jgi:hypothetical protein
LQACVAGPHAGRIRGIRSCAAVFGSPSDSASSSSSSSPSAKSPSKSSSKSSKSSSPSPSSSGALTTLAGANLTHALPGAVVEVMAFREGAPAIGDELEVYECDEVAQAMAEARMLAKCVSSAIFILFTL